MKIAIIGAGVSGLTTAYYLRLKFPDALQNPITIFEKGKVGGNADTFEVLLPDGTNPPINRWVDMGVNDFNLATYKPLRELWQDLKIMDKKDPCPTSTYCSPLIDTESFAFPGPDNKYSYRYSILENNQIEVPGDSSADPDHTLGANIDRFKTELANWYEKYEPEGMNPISVKTWLDNMKPRFSDEFITKNLYPRINGMYFTKEQATSADSIPPSEMPLWMVAHYYILQEAYGQPASPCKRQYFVKGSSQWLFFLAKKLQTEMGVTIPPAFNSNSFTKQPDGKIEIKINGGSVGIFDKVIFATHADVTYELLKNSGFEQDQMVSALQLFKYAKCDIVAHQDDTFLGPYKDYKQTYNIHIYDYKGKDKYPYSITYIVNMHQNDRARGINNPLFYLTVNPYWSNGIIRDEKILRQTNGNRAITTMKHCKLDASAVHGQMTIFNDQLGPKAKARSYYFAGSFAIGAGLHMECIIQAKAIAEKIFNNQYVPEHAYDFSGKRHFAPQYIMDAITLIKKKD